MSRNRRQNTDDLVDSKEETQGDDNSHTPIVKTNFFVPCHPILFIGK